MKITASGAALAAEVSGVDLAQPLAAGEIAELAAAWDEHLVLVFRGQDLSDPALLAFSRHFGELDPPGPNPYGVTFLPEFPEINVISNLKDDQGRPIGNLGAGEAVWHADMTYIETPPKGAILHALEVPLGQGDTHFANMARAYEELPGDLKAAIEGRKAIHDAAHNSAGMLRKGYEETDDPRLTPGAHHPLVREDPATGRRALFLGRRPRAYVIGLEPAESEDLLDCLWAHATQARYAWTHKWRPGDVLMWQNLWVLHRRDGFEETARRILHRTQIKGSDAIAG
jgi:alpha-ketoglutarate-dependent taurine dioxygenase